VKLKTTGTETFNMLCEVYGENNTISTAHMSEWHKRFSEERQDMEDDE
jgi:hypothetical protein